MLDWFLETIAYEQWATMQWLDILAEHDRIESIDSILIHSLRAQRSWLQAVSSERVWNCELTDFSGALAENLSAWKKWIEQPEALEQPYTFRIKSGSEVEGNVADVLRHVLNHGTYHRGQIRQIAESMGIPFPDTDFVYFVSATRTGKIKP